MLAFEFQTHRETLAALSHFEVKVLGFFILLSEKKFAKFLPVKDSSHKKYNSVINTHRPGFTDRAQTKPGLSHSSIRAFK